MTGHADRAPIDRRAFIAGAAAAPLFATSVAAGPTVLRVNATPSIFRSMFEALVQEFHRQHPGITVDLATNSRGQDEEFLSTLRRSLIHDLPDVSFQSFSYLRELKRRRLAVPLDEFIARDPAFHSDEYDPSLREIGRVGDTLVGLGAAISVPIIYYDIGRVDAVLGAHPIPGDWDSLLALVRALAGSARPRTLGALCQRDQGNWIFSAIVQGLGGRLMTPDESRVAFDGPAGLKTLEIYRSFGVAGQARADMDIDQARQAFVSGTVALLIDSSSTVASFERQVGARFSLGTARLPLTPHGRIPVSGIASVLHTRDATRQAMAWKFMKFVSGPVGQRIIGRSSGYFPANERVAHVSQGLGSYYATRPLVRPIIDTLPVSGPTHAFPGANASKIESVLFDEIGSVLTLAKTPAQALALMKRKVEALLPSPDSARERSSTVSAVRSRNDIFSET